MKKVYCKNCKYGTYRVFLYQDSKNWNWCEQRNPYTEMKIPAMTKEELNKNGECPYYKRKFWKFWVK